MRIVLATDAWRPQVNGVVRTWETSIGKLRDRGHAVTVVHPALFPSFPAPFYREIRLAIPSTVEIARRITEFQPDCIHIATEGSIGLAVRGLCRRRGWNFSTSYHSKFPEFLNHLMQIPESWTYRYMRWFHARSQSIMVATPTLERELSDRGFGRFRRWSRGVDLDLFYPRPRRATWPRPVMLYAGRVSREKNLDTFLSLDLPGTKVIVGDGPIRGELERRFPHAVFPGYCRGADLAQAYSEADVFVFPSKTDTFGLVMIEAMACGVPVAAYPVVGPIDIVTEPGTGALDGDLKTAIQSALRTGDRSACIRHAGSFTWDRCTDQLLSNFVPLHPTHGDNQTGMVRN